MKNSYQVGITIWRAGIKEEEPVTTADQVRTALLACGQPASAAGEVQDEDGNNGIWLVELSDAAAEEMENEGMLSLDGPVNDGTGDMYVIVAEMP